MNVIKQQRVGKIAYAVGRKFIAVEETHACDGCVVVASKVSIRRW